MNIDIIFKVQTETKQTTTKTNQNKTKQNKTPYSREKQRLPSTQNAEILIIKRFSDNLWAFMHSEF